MTDLEELRDEIRKLREEIAELKARPAYFYHYHYGPSPLQPYPYFPPSLPYYPTVGGSGQYVTNGDGNWARIS